MAKSKSDTRYLKKQHESWYFVIAVPRILVKVGTFPSEGRKGKKGQPNKPGKPLSKIIVSLNTRDKREAQAKRWPLVNEWTTNFKRAESGAELTPDEINDLARETYTATLERLEADAKRHRVPPARQIEDVWIELSAFGDLPPDRDRLADARFEVDDLTSFGSVEEDLAAAQRRKGVPLDPASDTFRMLGRALARAKVAA